MTFRLWTHLTMNHGGGGPVPETYEANIAITATELYLYHFDSDTETLVQTYFLEPDAGRLFTSCRWHPSGEWLAVCNVTNTSTDAQIDIYSWDGVDLTYVSTTQPLSNNGQHLAFSDDGNYAAISTANDSPYLFFYTFSAGVLTLLSGEPDAAPEAATWRWPEWNSLGNVILTGGGRPAYYERSGTDFTGALYSDPSSFYGDYGASWSPNAQFVAMCNNRPGAELLIYEEGVLIEQIDTQAGAAPCAFNEDGTLLAVGHSVSPYMDFFGVPDFDAVSFDGDALAGTASHMRWAGDYLVVTYNTTPFFSVLRHDGGGVFVTLSDPMDLPAAAASFMHAIRVPA